jgi:hypothetical protein
VGGASPTLRNSFVAVTRSQCYWGMSLCIRTRASSGNQFAAQIKKTEQTPPQKPQSRGSDVPVGNTLGCFTYRSVGNCLHPTRRVLTHAAVRSALPILHCDAPGASESQKLRQAAARISPQIEALPPRSVQDVTVSRVGAEAGTPSRRRKIRVPVRECRA